jgi:hypothetical protein
VKQNPTSGGLTTRNHEAIEPIAANQAIWAEELSEGLTETGRKYRVQVIVTDPDGQEILNLTRLAFEDEVLNGGYPTPDINTAIQLLVEAAGEWSA